MPAVTESSVAGQLLIGSRWVPAAGEDVRESRNPATGETLGSVAEAGQARPCQEVMWPKPIDTSHTGIFLLKNSTP